MKSDYIVIPEKGRAAVASEVVSLDGLLPNEAVLRAEATMISAGTELSRVFAIKQGFTYPVRPGYCAVGRVLAKGSALTDIDVGGRVFYSGPHASVCRLYRGERTQEPMLFPLPADIDPQAAALITLGLVAMSGVNATQVKLGDTLAVFGLGAIGLIAARSTKNAARGSSASIPCPVAARSRGSSALSRRSTVRRRSRSRR
ncbi:MAG: hypothetical protein VB092_01945 [Oscillospiraceae bacterium]|nr:hypothetical protein [Oscillospiraceae bacterium]